LKDPVRGSLQNGLRREPLGLDFRKYRKSSGSRSEGQKYGSSIGGDKRKISDAAEAL
jgi:hypothetical protein